MSRIRVSSPTVVATMAVVNHVPAVVASHFASVELGDVTYFWAAA